MDPDALMIAIGDAVNEGDRDTLVDACEAMVQWLRRGGFLPSVKVEVQTVDASSIAMETALDPLSYISVRKG